MTSDYFATGLGIFSSRADWTPSASWFVSKTSWNSQGHQFGDGNSIAFWRAGEWLTKPRTGCSLPQNMLEIRCPLDDRFAARETSLEQPKVSHSFATDYAYIEANSTQLYSNPSFGPPEVLHASRSTLFLKPDIVVVYDRATSTSPGTKRFWLNTPAEASIDGQSAVATTPSGQRLFIDAIFPKEAVLDTVFDEDGARLQIEDRSNPSCVRFLTVLQGADPGSTKAPAQSIISKSGTAYEGVIVGTVAVMFKQSFMSSFCCTTFEVPPYLTQCFVTGLAAHGLYTVVTTASERGVAVRVSAGGTVAADAAGVLRF